MSVPTTPSQGVMRIWRGLATLANALACHGVLLSSCYQCSASLGLLAMEMSPLPAARALIDDQYGKFPYIYIYRSYHR